MNIQIRMIKISFIRERRDGLWFSSTEKPGKRPQDDSSSINQGKRAVGVKEKNGATPSVLQLTVHRVDEQQVD